MYRTLLVLAFILGLFWDTAHCSKRLDARADYTATHKADETVPYIVRKLGKAELQFSLSSKPQVTIALPVRFELRRKRAKR